MNNLKLENLIRSIRAEGIKKKQFYHKTIALALWNQLNEDDRRDVFNHLIYLKHSDTELDNIIKTKQP